MAFTGVAALVSAVGAGTAVTASMVLVAVAEVGLALSVVGAVTGNETLMKIGGVMSLVGGVGGAIAGAGAGAAGGAAAEAGLESAAADAFTEAGTSLAGDLATPGLDALDAGLTTGEMFADASGSAAMAPGGLLGGPAQSAGGILNDAASGAATPSASASTTSVAPGASGDQALGTSQANLGNVDATTTRVANATDVTSGADKVLGPGGNATPANSWYSGVGDFWKGLGDNSKAAVIKTGTGLLQGAAQGADNKEKNDIARAKLQQSSYGSAVPKGVLKGAPA